MKKSFLWVILVMVLLSSCVTQRKCDRKFPPQEYTNVKDSTVIKDSVIYSYAEIPVYIKGDTVIMHDFVFKDKKTGLINSKPVYAETDFAKATAQVINSQLKLELVQKDSTFNVITDSLMKEVYHWKEQYNSVNSLKVKQVEYIPKIYTIFALIGLLGVVGTLLYFIFKLKDKLHLTWPR